MFDLGYKDTLYCIGLLEYLLDLGAADLAAILVEYIVADFYLIEVAEPVLLRDVDHVNSYSL